MRRPRQRGGGRAREAERRGAASSAGPASRLSQPVTLAEVRDAVASAASGKAAGPDGIGVQMLRHGGDAMLHALHVPLGAVWQEERVADAWLLAHLKPLYKGEEARTDVSNYRPIALMSVVAKLYERVLHDSIAAL